MSTEDLEFAQYNLGIQKQYDFTQYSHDNHVNVIPEKDFKHLVEETFRTIADILRKTYGPYASTVIISDQSETVSTKDGYNVFNAVGFSHKYKRLVYLAISKIIERVNKNVGDGTTSCILLAEKMFKEIEGILKTVDDRRNILSVMDKFEERVLDHELIQMDYKNKLVRPLTATALKGLISMAGNYDDRLTDVIMEALAPVVNPENDQVISTQNVVVEVKPDLNGQPGTSYEIDYLPGDYRIRVKMEPEVAYAFDIPRKIRVVVYDHTFGLSDWNFFMQNYDKETPTLIIARAVSKAFYDKEFAQYCKQLMALSKKGYADIPILFAEIKGDYLQDEIKDLCAVLGTKPVDMSNVAINHDDLPVVPVQVFRGNCMCFGVDTIPEGYIRNLEAEMDADLTNSMVKHAIYKERIRALRHELKQSMVTIRSSSSLESKMIQDKIDDCLSIVNSALEYGIVPNMLAYGYYRMETIFNQTDALEEYVAKAIQNSIRGLFRDIWESKHGDSYPNKFDTIADEFYDDDMAFDSFDIVKESFCDVEELPTSARYDLEVIAASISIVKYLLTSRALIFDAFMMTPVDDTGSYVPR